MLAWFWYQAHNMTWELSRNISDLTHQPKITLENDLDLIGIDLWLQSQWINELSWQIERLGKYFSLLFRDQIFTMFLYWNMVVTFQSDFLRNFFERFFTGSIETCKVFWIKKPGQSKTQRKVFVLTILFCLWTKHNFHRIFIQEFFKNPNVSWNAIRNLI